MSYDNIDTPLLTCPNLDCKKRLTGFRSENGPCQDKQLPFYMVNKFYTSCECGTEVSYNRKFFEEVPITDYQINYDLPIPPKGTRAGFTMVDEDDSEDSSFDEEPLVTGKPFTESIKPDSLPEGSIDEHLIETFHPLEEDNFEDDAGFSDINSQVSVEDNEE